MMWRLVVAALSLVLTDGAFAAHSSRRHAPPSRGCLVEVLHSEELPVGPLFYHTIKATLLVTAPGRPPFETTVYKAIPWQVPPPRPGERVRVSCIYGGSNFNW